MKNSNSNGQRKKPNYTTTRRKHRREIYFGFGPDETSDDFMPEIRKDETPICMIRKVTKELINDVQETDLSDYKLGQWFIATKKQGKPRLTGPYDSHLDAWDDATEWLGVERITNDPFDKWLELK